MSEMEEQESDVDKSWAYIGLAFVRPSDGNLRVPGVGGNTL